MATRKFGRKYLLRIQSTTGGKDIVVKPPFTIEVQINRNTLSSVNNASLRIYNLGEKARNQIQKDSREYNLSKRVELLAGYGNRMYVIFAGNILQAYSMREGTNFITTIEAYDGGFAITNTTVEAAHGAGTSYRKIVTDMMESFGTNGVKRGVIGEVSGFTGRGSAFNGTAMEHLREITGGDVFIDNEKINVLGIDEYIGGTAPTITSKTGLIGTPKVESTMLSFQLIFEPRLFLGQRVRIESTTQGKLVNGRFYKIISLKHRGIFSEASSGSMITEAGAFFGVKGLRAVTR